jgi:hypothetical protein
MFDYIYCEVFEVHAASAKNLCNFFYSTKFGARLAAATYKGVKVYSPNFTGPGTPLFFRDRLELLLDGRGHESQRQPLASSAGHHPTMIMCTSNPGKVRRGTNLQAGALSGERCRNDNVARPRNWGLRLSLEDIPRVGKIEELHDDPPRRNNDTSSRHVIVDGLIQASLCPGATRVHTPTRPNTALPIDKAVLFWAR